MRISDIFKLLKLLESDFVRQVLCQFISVFQRGIYEVINYQTTLEIVEQHGTKAVYRKHQKVRFLQNNIIAYQDQAVGEGNIFADYRCAPGLAVDRYQDGNRWRVLISLRESKSRGDVEDFFIERTIKNGFIRSSEYFLTNIDHPTRRLAMRVVFPEKRPPQRIILFEQNANRTTELGPKHTQILPDGRHQVSWQTKRPRRFETYTLRWEW